MKASIRDGLPDSAFGLEKERKYPEDTRKRAANAKARAAQGVKKGSLSRSQEATIDRKADRRYGFGGKKAA